MKSQITGSPVLNREEDSLYVGDLGGHVYKLNAADGTLIWNYTMGAGADTEPTLSSHYVYITSFDGMIYSLRQTTGTVRWSYKCTAKGRKLSPYSALPIEVTDESIYVGLEGAEKLFKLDKTDSTIRWSYTFRQFVGTTPVLNDGSVYLAGHDKKLYKFDGETMEIKWSYLNDVPFTTPTVINRSWTDDGVWGDSSLYVGAMDKLFRIEPGGGLTGRVAWSYKTEGNVGLAAIHETDLFFGDAAGFVYRMDGYTSLVKWSYEVATRVTMPPLISHGSLLTSSPQSPKIYRLNLDDGTVMWSHWLGGDVIGAPVENSDGTEIFVSTSKAQIMKYVIPSWPPPFHPPPPSPSPTPPSPPELPPWPHPPPFAPPAEFPPPSPPPYPPCTGDPDKCVKPFGAVGEGASNEVQRVRFPPSPPPNYPFSDRAGIPRIPELTRLFLEPPTDAPRLRRHGGSERVAPMIPRTEVFLG